MEISRKCRYCKNNLSKMVIDLGMAPLSNDYLNEEDISRGQFTLPLRLMICDSCKLVQVADFEMPDKIFNSNYKYFSSYSESWLTHCEKYVDMIVKRLNLNEYSKVVEIASNDGYLLQYFSKYRIKPLGIEPSTSTASVAREKGIETLEEFFDRNLAVRLKKEGRCADLLIGNNVLAHVPDIGSFVAGLSEMIKPTGTITIEFPHFLNILTYKQFDTIYHEHFSYLTLLSIDRIFRDNYLKIYDVEKLPTHGGSLRIYASKIDNAEFRVSDKVKEVLQEELDAGLDDFATYVDFNRNVEELKLQILKKLIDIRESGKTVVGYGAAAKGNTMFNYFGIKSDLITYVVDANPHKQGLYMPGSLIPIYSPEKIRETRPDYVLIIPWNIKDEIANQNKYIREWGGRFMTFIPEINEW